MEQDQKDLAQKEAIARQFMIKAMNEKYLSLIANLRELPINPASFMDGIKMMDFGMLWIKEAVQYSPILYPVQQNSESDSTKAD